MKRHVGEHSSEPVVLSVVCATRNVAHCIEGLLESYRRERTAQSQLIVLDGASTDATWDIVLRHRDVVDIAISEPDSGIYDAWNKGIALCSGTHVAFIGADDRLACGSINALIESCCATDTDPHIVAGFNVLTRGSVPVALLGSPFIRARLYRRMMIAHVMSAHNLSWLVSVRGFDASFQSSGDYELLLRERRSLRINVINHILAYMEDGGRSRTNLRPHTENFRARLKNGYPLWLCAALLARAMMGRAARRLLRL
jgi:glycosyltransferase involved in cell wall biosynthesis